MTAPKEQSDQGLDCLPFHLHLLDVLLRTLDMREYLMIPEG